MAVGSGAQEGWERRLWDQPSMHPQRFCGKDAGNKAKCGPGLSLSVLCISYLHLASERWSLPLRLSKAMSNCGSGW